MKTTIGKLSALDLCAAMEIIILLCISVFYAYRYENAQILSGVCIGTAVGVLVMAIMEHTDQGDLEQ